MADHMLNTVKHSLTPAVRTERAQKAIEAKEHSTFLKKEQQQGLTETSPFITCGHCTVEFRKIDIQRGGKCPVCDRPLRY